MRVNAPKLLSSLSANVCMTQSKKAEGAQERKTKKEVNEKTIRTYCYNKVFSIHAVKMDTCRHPNAIRGDEGMTLTGAPCMPMSPGLPGNPG